MLSEFLKSRMKDAKALCIELRKTFKYVSVLGTDVRVQSVMANRMSTSIQDEGLGSECGFVVKMKNDNAFFEYSLDDILGDKEELAKKIISSLKIDKELEEKMIQTGDISDEPLEKSFIRESDLDSYSVSDKLEFVTKLKDLMLTKSENILNAVAVIQTLNVSKIFVTEHRTLDQNYTWVNGNLVLVYRENDQVVQCREGAWDITVKKTMEELPKKMDKLLDKAHHLAFAKPIEPGMYDIITDPSITGLIAHEAFGHGVEMDQFVKDRALAKQYVGKYVASPIVNMRDGAASVVSTASYFFDDDGVLAQDTLIIKDGILVSGISDMASALQLGTKPTGNGRREAFSHKAYTRMTNTFFLPGKDKLSDMIKSVKHGYYICETNNGMEDPKNWAIQCVAEYGIEIVDGKLTDNWVSPVVMSGYVPDLLKSITMVSDGLEIEGAGACGKGYKEWVRVTDGGPSLKAKVKLG
ncbi:MAG: TldD/PmbA family protein [Acholeplasmatales bacterium]|jgi:TldD protein|nr:TldD/PmbA family protein [Acholeplasmatales bacterium]